jgi:glucan 1,3-beta-glucosidase
MGVCEALGVSGSVFDGKFKSWQTGGAGAGTIAASATAQFPWPPASISNAGAPGSLLPVYTPTGTIVTLPPPTLTPSPSKSVDVGNGWFNAKDTASAPTSIAGCSYPDAWDAIGVAVPSACGGGAVKRAPATTAEANLITPAASH